MTSRRRHFRQHSPHRGVALWVATLGAVGLSACQPAQQSSTTVGMTEFEWARAALSRNPNVDIVATDAETQVFTVRDRNTNQIQVLGTNEIAAAPLGSLITQADRTGVPQPTAREEPPDASAADSQITPAEETFTAAADDSKSPAGDTGAYTIERTGGQLRVSGPGVSIVSAGGEGGPASTGRDERFSDPIICEGARMMHLDGRQMRVDGDAITVRGGCELHVTNSRIAATGTAIFVLDGTVHISNSHIEGALNSFDADDRAKVVIRSSTFVGIPRRAELAQIQDQGGNRWR
jgi:hypothetical protein